MQGTDIWTWLLPRVEEAPSPAPPEASDISTAIQSLVPALSQAFAVILVGYACVKLNVVQTAHKQGLSLFVTRLALPALLFSGMASLDFSKVNWFFLLAVTIGKTFVFVVAVGITILLDIGKPHVLGAAGVHAIFVSQSNDFAMGLPIFLPIFGSSHPEYISYLYLVAPISLIILNPLGFILMETCQKAKSKEDALLEPSTSYRSDVPERMEEGYHQIVKEKNEKHQLVGEEDFTPLLGTTIGNFKESEDSMDLNSEQEAPRLLPRLKFPNGVSSPLAKQSGSLKLGSPIMPNGPRDWSFHGNKGSSSKPETLTQRSTILKTKPCQEMNCDSNSELWKIMYSVISSPIVFMVPVGLVANVVFNHNIPPILAGPFQTFGSAFLPLSLFILGMSMADQTEATGEEVTRLGPLIVALALIAGKCLLLPIVITLLLINFDVPTSLVVAGLVFGALPCTPATFFFASEYGFCQAWIGTATVLGTFLFAPLVYVVVQLAFLVMNHYDAFQDQICKSAHTMAIIGLIGAIWTLLAMGFSQWKQSSSSVDERNLMHQINNSFIACIAISWAISCVGTFTCEGTPFSPTLSVARYFAISGGETAAKIFTTLVAVSEYYSLIMGRFVVSKRKGLIIFLGWISAIIITAVPFLMNRHLPSSGLPDLMTCWYPYGKPQLYTVGITTGICVSLITSVTCKFVWNQFDNAQNSGDKFVWSNLQLVWQPYSKGEAPVSQSAHSSQINVIPGLQERKPYLNQGINESFSPGSRQLSRHSSTSYQDFPPRILLEGARSFLSSQHNMGGNRQQFPYGGNGTYALNKDVSLRWKQKSLIDEHNSMLLFCGFSVMWMLVTISICVTALWNNGSMKRDSAQGGLLLLLATVLGCGQGAILFLAHGLYPGLVQPLVALRESWVKHRNCLFFEENQRHERPRWTDVFAGEVDDCGPRYEKVWKQLGGSFMLSAYGWPNYIADENPMSPGSRSGFDPGEDQVLEVTDDENFQGLFPVGTPRTREYFATIMEASRKN